jgi:hypothetical protein
MGALALLVTMAACTQPTAPVSTQHAESRPEGVSRVVDVGPNTDVGYRLSLENGTVLAVGPPGTVTLVQTTNGPDSLAVYGHDDRGLWLVWLAYDSIRDCFALPVIGYDRGGFVGWPAGGFALPKAANFHLDAAISLGKPGTPLDGAYFGGGESPYATFCISEDGEVESVSE